MKLEEALEITDTSMWSDEGRVSDDLYERGGKMDLTSQVGADSWKINDEWDVEPG